MTRPDDSPRSANAPALGLSEGARLLISFLLFLHLFALLVGISSRATATASGRETIEMRLRNVPHKSLPLVQAYLQLLWMDLSYSYHLTYGPTGAAVGDSAVWIDVELDLPDGTKAMAQLPDSRVKLPLRRLHYEGLARRAAELSDSANQSGTLPQAIAARLVAETGATGGRMWIRQASLPIEPFITPSGNPRTLYEAAIIVAPQGVLVSKISAAAESAPAASTQEAR